MKILKLLLMVMVPFCIVKGQNTETDSLKKLLPLAKGDINKVGLLESLSYAYLASSPDTALQYAMEGLDLARMIGDKNGEAICINALGNVNFHVGDYTKALEQYLQALQLKEQVKKKVNLAVYYFNISNVYTMLKDSTQALYYLFKTMKADEKANDSSGIMFDLYSLSVFYLNMGNADSSRHYLQQAYTICNRLDDKNMVPAILTKYGDIYAYQKELNIAKDFYHNGVFYAMEINDNQVLSEVYLALARVFKETNAADSAAYFARKSMLLASEAPFLNTVFEASTFLANSYKGQRKYDSAFKYLEKSISIKDSLYNIDNVKKVQNLKLQEQQRQQSITAEKVALRSKVKLYIVIFTSLIFLLIAVFLWRNNKQKQKAFVLLKNQKAMTDSALENLRDTQSQLVLREKMASLGELTAGIAHEIQNPLNFVNNFSEVNIELLTEMKDALGNGRYDEVQLLANDVIDNEEKINQHGKRADGIVKSMLHHSQTSTEVKELVEINSLADEYLMLAYHGLRAKDKTFNIKLNTDFDETIGKVELIPQDIGRVFLNLFNNAFYAVLEKKKSGAAGYEPAVWVSTRKSGRFVEIKVKDNGMGIPESAREKIFQPFFTTKPTGQGTGLGLSLSYDIVRVHNGSIKVGSTIGEGTEFTIQLPLYN